ncbi:TMV resistance protein N-like [Pyrus ussuriensis x Pyrus communis]|uniref:TMV resistance protein N-like n=1 Tax=Pyrus ussuriensis x Pyrus communis TaxID=2448454 RepID=A0A5N5G960_9ROSA|nr:TMV resistance protein N-like [Pyrus ussuriensis x Pyrus communis]
MCKFGKFVILFNDVQPLPFNCFIPCGSSGSIVRFLQPATSRMRSLTRLFMLSGRLVIGLLFRRKYSNEGSIVRALGISDRLQRSRRKLVKECGKLANEKLLDSIFFLGDTDDQIEYRDLGDNRMSFFISQAVDCK